MFVGYVQLVRSAVRWAGGWCGMGWGPEVLLLDQGLGAWILSELPESGQGAGLGRLHHVTHHHTVCHDWD